jgi:two-component SAPR family response regulator
MDEERLKRAQATAPFSYVIKPFEERELHSTIERALKETKMES